MIGRLQILSLAKERTLKSSEARTVKYHCKRSTALVGLLRRRHHLG